MGCQVVPDTDRATVDPRQHAAGIDLVVVHREVEEARDVLSDRAVAAGGSGPVLGRQHDEGTVIGPVAGFDQLRDAELVHQPEHRLGAIAGLAGPVQEEEERAWDH